MDDAADRDGRAVVAIAASAGALPALVALLSALPPDFPAAVLVAHHQSTSYRSQLAALLDAHCCLPVRVAVAGERLRPGAILLAPHGRHLTVGHGWRIAVPDDPPMRYVRPSADLLFSSVAAHCGSRAVAIVLSGAGSDGARGIVAVKDAGGVVIVQDVASAPFPSMPQAAIRTGKTDLVLLADEMPPALIQLTA
jgi:two-component system, chemotaxis family, protein-glutamate methylesterase/glutaminase